MKARTIISLEHHAVSLWLSLFTMNTQFQKCSVVHRCCWAKNLTLINHFHKQIICYLWVASCLICKKEIIELIYGFVLCLHVHSYIEHLMNSNILHSRNVAMWCREGLPLVLLMAALASQLRGWKCCLVTSLVQTEISQQWLCWLC